MRAKRLCDGSLNSWFLLFPESIRLCASLCLPEANVPVIKIIWDFYVFTGGYICLSNFCWYMFLKTASFNSYFTWLRTINCFVYSKDQRKSGCKTWCWWRGAPSFGCFSNAYLMNPQLSFSKAGSASVKPSGRG